MLLIVLLDIRSSLQLGFALGLWLQNKGRPKNRIRHQLNHLPHSRSPRSAVFRLKHQLVLQITALDPTARIFILAVAKLYLLALLAHVYVSAAAGPTNWSFLWSCGRMHCPDAVACAVQYAWGESRRKPGLFKLARVVVEYRLMDEGRCNSLSQWMAFTQLDFSSAHPLILASDYNSIANQLYNQPSPSQFFATSQHPPKLCFKIPSMIIEYAIKRNNYHSSSKYLNQVKIKLLRKASWHSK